MSRFSQLGQDIGQAAGAARDLARNLDQGGASPSITPAGGGGDVGRALTRLAGKISTPPRASLSSTEFRALGKLEP